MTRQAEADMVGIARYTRRQWNETQEEKYIQELFEALAQIANNPGIGRQYNKLKPGLRIKTYKKLHYICYRVMEDQVEILRILHAKQNIQQQIAKLR
ncbi:MAG: type II toxin-antitoxin system RelE/ParE family toxin [Prochloron sp. SP5CPC1]|nr:type II toxin-antitoxin system RelE/ParE family toxin [Candidatus Paraprochloron terpiosi SP5CPC1]